MTLAFNYTVEPLQLTCTKLMCIVLLVSWLSFWVLNCIYLWFRCM